jgi:hypothetical protein
VRRRDAGDGVDASEQRRLESIGFVVESAQELGGSILAFNLLSFFLLRGAPGQQPPSVPKRMAPKSEGGEKATRYYGVVMRASLTVAWMIASVAEVV